MVRHQAIGIEMPLLVYRSGKDGFVDVICQWRIQERIGEMAGAESDEVDVVGAGVVEVFQSQRLPAPSEVRPAGW